MSRMDFYPVFVNHIANSVHPGELRAIFERYGDVMDVLILADYGFVNMAREEEAHEAIERVNSRLLHGQRLHVDYSEELKMFFSSRRIRITGTLDPTSSTTSRHPPYPDGPHVRSPFAQDGSLMDSQDLLDPETIDQRLQRVNKELERIRESEYRAKSSSRRSDYKRRPRRSRSRSRYRRNSSNENRQGSRNPSNWDRSLSPADRSHRNPLSSRPELGSVRSPVREWCSHSQVGRSRSRSPREHIVRSEGQSDRRETPWKSGREEQWIDGFGGFEDNIIRGSSRSGRDSGKSANRPSYGGTYSLPSKRPDFNDGEAGVDIFDFFIGGLVRKVSSYDLADLFSRFGRITKSELKKNFAFVFVETSEERAMDAVKQLSGTFQFGNKISVQFRRGSKYEHLNDVADRETRIENTSKNERKRRISRPSMSDDGIVIVGEFGKGIKSSIQENSSFVAQFQPSIEHERKGHEYSDQGESRKEGDVKSNDVLSALLDTWHPKEDPGGSLKCKEPSCADLKKIMETIHSAEARKTAECQPTIEGEGPKAQRKIHVSGLNSRVDDFDLKDLFGRYGQINRVDCKITYGTYTRYGFVFIFCSEYTAVQCVCELDGLLVKGSKIKVSFMRGSYEESKEFKEKWASQISIFNSQDHKAKVEKEFASITTQPTRKVNLSQIGEGLNSLDMSLSLDPVHPTYKNASSNPFSGLYNDKISIPAAAGSQYAFLSETGPCQTKQGSSSFQGTNMSDCLTNVDATIHSIQNKMILLEFFSPASGIKSLAKLVPGQMYINGQQSLGFLIKSNAFHTWPKMLKDFLQLGKAVKMDARRLTEKEMHEGKDKEKTILWTTPLLWQPGHRPSEEEVILTMERSGSQVSTAVVTQLYSSWGILSHPQGNIVFKVEQMFWETAPLKPSSSLLTDTEVELGDRLAVHFRQSKPGEMAVAGAPLTSLTALLVWVVASEVDPWVYYNWPNNSTVNFLATSSVLSRQLPGDSEAEHLNLKGTVEEIHLPAGGVVKLTQESLDTLLSQSLGINLEAKSRVYFHRSRLYINGSKIQSDQCLDREIVPGDEVDVDLVRNGTEVGDKFVVGHRASWVALAARCHTVMRGVHLAARMKEESIIYAADGNQVEDAVKARVVYLKPPSEPGGPSTSGVAVLDSGDFLGQRVEFDRDVCALFGLSLARADLSRVIGRDEMVNVKLKPYNSYCVEKLWMGALTGTCTETHLGMNEGPTHGIQSWLIDHGLSQASLDLVVKGQVQPRHFLPLPTSHQLAAQVVEVVNNGGIGAFLMVKTTCGRTFKVDRGVVFAFGWWLGKADLSLLLSSNEQVLLELEPRFSAGVRDLVSLAWLGGPGDRPTYKGLDFKSFISEITDSHLKLWLAGKNLEMAQFKWIVEGGSLNSIKVQGEGEVVDQETLAQANILKKMKEKFGSEKTLTALMSMMQAPPAPPPPTSPPKMSASQRGYYSSGAITATYSSSPQPPSSQTKPQGYLPTTANFTQDPSPAANLGLPTFQPSQLPAPPPGHPTLGSVFQPPAVFQFSPNAPPAVTSSTASSHQYHQNQPYPTPQHPAYYNMHAYGK